MKLENGKQISIALMGTERPKINVGDKDRDPKELTKR